MEKFVRVSACAVTYICQTQPGPSSTLQKGGLVQQLGYPVMTYINLLIASDPGNMQPRTQAPPHAEKWHGEEPGHEARQHVQVHSLAWEDLWPDEITHHFSIILAWTLGLAM